MAATKRSSAKSGASTPALALSRDDARRLAIRAQLLTDDRPDDVLAAVHGLSMLQVDLTDAVAPSAELVL